MLFLDVKIATNRISRKLEPSYGLHETVFVSLFFHQIPLSHYQGTTPNRQQTKVLNTHFSMAPSTVLQFKRLSETPKIFMWSNDPHIPIQPARSQPKFDGFGGKEAIAEAHNPQTKELCRQKW